MNALRMLVGRGSPPLPMPQIDDLRSSIGHYYPGRRSVQDSDVSGLMGCARVLREARSRTEVGSQLSQQDDVLPRARDLELVVAPILRRYGGYCEALFEELASAHPDVLATVVLKGDLPASKLTFAAEILGTVPDHRLAVAVLRSLLRHPSPLVREGAIYGLAKASAVSELDHLRRIVTSDPSPGVRAAAQATVEELS